MSPNSDALQKVSVRADVLALLREKRYEEALAVLYRARSEAPADRELQKSIDQIKQFLVGAYAKRLGGLDRVAGAIPPSAVRSPDLVLLSRYVDGSSTFGDIAQMCPLGQLRTLQLLVGLYSVTAPPQRIQPEPEAPLSGLRLPPDPVGALPEAFSAAPLGPPDEESDDLPAPETARSASFASAPAVPPPPSSVDPSSVDPSSVLSSSLNPSSVDPHSVLPSYVISSGATFSGSAPGSSLARWVPPSQAASSAVTSSAVTSSAVTSSAVTPSAVTPTAAARVMGARPVASSPHVPVSARAAGGAAPSVAAPSVGVAAPSVGVAAAAPSVGVAAPPSVGVAAAPASSSGIPSSRVPSSALPFSQSQPESEESRRYREAFALGTAAFVQGHFREAVEAFEACMQLRPGDRGAEVMLRRSRRDLESRG